MCGILGIFELKEETKKLRQQALIQAKILRHRGPDWSGIYTNENCILVHERLSIVDPKSGKQPMKSVDGKQVLAANGEIYNHQALRDELAMPYSFQTKSDCEVIIALYRQEGIKFLEKINGIFAFALYDQSNNSYLIARDHMGIVPLYMGWDIHKQLYVSSELKALEGYCKEIQEFPPGHYLCSVQDEVIRWYNPQWNDYTSVANQKSDMVELRRALERAVYRQLMTDVPYGVLLSGGLDSSIIAALVKKYADKRVESTDQENAWWPSVHSFAIGLEDSPDLKAAQEVADHIGTIHHEITFSIQEGLDAIHDVIYHLETYDVTTVRASTPMYLLARVIKSMGIKMVLSGEGSDEIFGGYLYFHKAPNDKEFHEETVRKLHKLHLYDCLRVNKSLAAWGVEGRVPFLDKHFLDAAMNIAPKDKMVRQGMEKWILRKTFEDLLPERILWRQKEQFSDGVGYEWIDTLKDYASSIISDEALAQSRIKFPIHPPQTKEEYYYRSIFSMHFPSESAARCVPSVPSIACSSAEAIQWDTSFQERLDPSGRAIKNVHEESYI